jgi:DNA-binding MarR family transcriptional regulator
VVRREPCEDDARGSLLAPTPAGTKVVRDAAPPHVRSVRRNLIDLLTPDELDVLAGVAAKALEHLGIATAGLEGDAV